ncbi:phosphate transport system permease protein PstA [Clostridia bacterium]|nr:phosphate transport system permease protein PstA [Clostridia bacterium]
MKKTKPSDWILKILVYLSALITALVLLFIILYILVKGVPYLTPSLFALKYTSANVSMFPAIINTLITCVISLCIAVPFGIFTAVYLVEYAKSTNKFVGVIRLMTETLAGIPSIVYGLFGFLCFVSYFKWGYSVLAGACTLSIMVMPSIMRTTEEALLSTPESYREGAFGLGAGKLRTIFRIVLPAAAPGILSGVILAIGRIVGETAAIIYTSGTAPKLMHDVFSSARTLAVHMYALSTEGLHMRESYATAVVLLAMVAVINTVSTLLAKKLQGDM